MSRLFNFFCLSVIITLLFESVLYSQTLKINEFMASNTKTLKDPDYKSYSDWIEIYNFGSVSVNLKKMYISDNLKQPKKYQFTTDVEIKPKSYLLIWADDKNNSVHTNFKLSATGESIGLYDSLGNVIDTLSFISQSDDISYGRVTDGSLNWFYLNPSSPGAANLESSISCKLEIPIMTPGGGFYLTKQTVAIKSQDTNAVIRYTLDGSFPNETSQIYTKTLNVDSTMVIKAKIFKAGYKPSNTIVANYFINEQTKLPIVSISTDPNNFFSDTSGIYVAGTNGVIGHCSTVPRNWNQDWERPVDVQLYEKDRTKGFSAFAGIKIYGGCTRLYDMKSLAFYFRGSYGYDKLKYQLFPWLNINEYNNFTLKSSGQDWYRTMFRDGMCQTLIRQSTTVDAQAYRPSVVFINGRYWGIHNICEKINEHFVNNHFGVDPDSVDLIEYGKTPTASNGDVVAYNVMSDYIANNDLSIKTNYEHLKTLIDIDEYIDYMCSEIYVANGDWPGANTKLWRTRKPSAKWRWMIYDLDCTFGGNGQGLYNTNTIDLVTATNSTTGANPPWSTLMLRKLLANSEFENEFIQRFATHINTTFRTSRVLNVIDSLRGLIADEIPRHKKRWTKTITMGSDWEANVQVMRDFAIKRPDAIRGYFNTKFGLQGTYSIKLSRNNTLWGKIYVNTLEVKYNDSLNIYFKNVPINIKAVPVEGYRFVKWEGLSNSASSEIAITGNANSELRAVFEKITNIEENKVGQISFQLLQNYPNPFNPTTTIKYSIPESGYAILKVYDIIGRDVATLISGYQTKGEHSVVFDAKNLPSGMYFYKLESGNLNKTMKMILLK